MDKPLQLNELQLEKLKKVCTMGAENATTAISQMIKRKIIVGAPDISVVPISKVVHSIGDPEVCIAGIYCKILGEISGGLLITLPAESSFVLVDILLNKSIGETKLLGELDRSALQETGNIIAASFVSALAKITNKSLLISVPKFAFNMAGAVIDLILIELAEVAEQTVVMEIVFSDVPKTLNGKIFILPDHQSLELLTNKI